MSLESAGSDVRTLTMLEFLADIRDTPYRISHAIQVAESTLIIMKKILIIAILAALGWKAYEKYRHNSGRVATTREHVLDVKADVADAPDIDLKRSAPSVFACDGRTHYSQMKSCDEAKYFVQNCPNVKMDGDNDGIPCETQWCT